MSSSLWRTTWFALIARTCSSSHSVRLSDTASPPRVTARRWRSIARSSTRTVAAPRRDARRATQHGAHARGELVGMERLGEVVVRAEVEAARTIRRRALRRQEDHRHRARLAQAAHDLEAVDVGHDDVQQDDVGLGLLGLAEGLLAAQGADHAEAVVGERHGHEAGDPGLVVGDEHERLGVHDRPTVRPWRGPGAGTGTPVPLQAHDNDPSREARSLRAPARGQPWPRGPSIAEAPEHAPRHAQCERKGETVRLAVRAIATAAQSGQPRTSGTHHLWDGRTHP